MGIGGVWAPYLEGDDPQNSCGCGKFPKMKATLVGMFGANYCNIPQCL